jgi:hypothetical protein
VVEAVGEFRFQGVGVLPIEQTGAHFCVYFFRGITDGAEYSGSIGVTHTIFLLKVNKQHQKRVYVDVLTYR